jgi:hypothetical protein
MGYATDSPAHAAGELGVTRLAQSCGHVFCRKECVRLLSFALDARADRRGQHHEMDPRGREHTRSAVLAGALIVSQKETCPMCRTRLLPAADEHPADADADAGPGHPRTMEEFMTAFRMPENFMEEMAPHFAGLRRDLAREDADTDRSEFSSMYS